MSTLEAAEYNYLSPKTRQQLQHIANSCEANQEISAKPKHYRITTKTLEAVSTLMSSVALCLEQMVLLYSLSVVGQE